MQSRNLGKGAAVKRGMLEAAGDIAFFMDADLSVSAEQLPACIAFMRDGNHPILIGSRRAPGGAMVIPQPAVRQTLGQCFTFFTRMLLVGEIQDFTCGFKGFRRDVGRLLFAAQQHADWSFDAEVLYLARLLGIPVHQYPVRWEHRDGSRVRFPRDIIKTSIALFQIRLRTPLVARRLSGPAPGLVPEGVRHT
jgi:dolichyl-phosphate beta-glucosyltransferase